MAGREPRGARRRQALTDAIVAIDAMLGTAEALRQSLVAQARTFDDEAMRRSAELLRRLRKEQPDGKVTRALASRRSLRLRPLVCVIDECQNVFMHPRLGARAADDAGYVKCPRCKGQRMRITKHWWTGRLRTRPLRCCSSTGRVPRIGAPALHRKDVCPRYKGGVASSESV